MDNQEEELIETTEDAVENIVPGISLAEHERVRQEALEKAKNTRHAWIQKGRGVLVCSSCVFPHRVFIDMDKKLVGIDDSGFPILKTD